MTQSKSVKFRKRLLRDNPKGKGVDRLINFAYTGQMAVLTDKDQIIPDRELALPCIQALFQESGQFFDPVLA